MTAPSNPITVAVLGAGHRGRAYAEQMVLTGGAFEVVAVAESDPGRREAFANCHGIKAGKIFSSSEEFLAAPRIADMIVVALMDQDHVRAAVEALRKGYHVLLEKPMATTLEDCQLIERTQKETGKTVLVCHVLRYHRVNQKVKAHLNQGAIGRIVNIDHV